MESTVSRAYHTMKNVLGIRVFDRIVLNHLVCGINISAVEATLKIGGKQLMKRVRLAKLHIEVVRIN